MHAIDQKLMDIR